MSQIYYRSLQASSQPSPEAAEISAPDSRSNQSNGTDPDIVIAEILDLLAQALIADLKGDTADIGRVPEGNEP